MAAFPPGITTAPQQLPGPSPAALIPVTYAVEDVMSDVMSDLMGISELLTPAPGVLPPFSPY